jgi:hypothetical protein
MTTIALTDSQLRQVTEIAEAIAPQLRGDYLEHIAADLRHRCDRDGSVGDGDVYRAALAARAAIAAGALITKSLGP